MRLAHPGTWTTRRLWLLPAAAGLVVLGLGVALLVLVVEPDDRPRAEVGDVFDAPLPEEEALEQRNEVLLPWARVQVGAGEPRPELPDLSGAEANIRAPEGGSFVRVEATLVEDGLIPLTAVAAPYTMQTEVVLRADGRDYPLSGPGGLVLDPNDSLPQGGTRWVAVDGEPTDLEVRVTVDGLTQVVDATDGSVERGRAAELSELPSPEQLANADGVDCGDARRADGSSLRLDYPKEPECVVQRSLRTPYVDGLGWAEPGREFLVVHVVRPRTVTLVSGRGESTTSWDEGRARLTARLGGERSISGPMSVNSLNQSRLAIADPDDPEQLIFDVARGDPVGDLTVRLTVPARKGEPFATDRSRIVLQWTVPGRKLA